MVPLRRWARCRLNAGFRKLAESFDQFERELVAPIEGAKRDKVEKFLLLLSNQDAIAAFIANAGETEDDSTLENIFGATAVTISATVVATPAILPEVAASEAASAWDDWESVAL